MIKKLIMSTKHNEHQGELGGNRPQGTIWSVTGKSPEPAAATRRNCGVEPGGRAEGTSRDWSASARNQIMGY